ncbi:hypothetical protein QCA50_010275 [Cerrena zonata]|uniref:Uncharacterized protein n=1 Tax=Cerrena zonata TaxID=2478898 RepID=A0AAW0G6B4_9APHY
MVVLFEGKRDFHILWEHTFAHAFRKKCYNWISKQNNFPKLQKLFCIWVRRTNENFLISFLVVKTFVCHMERRFNNSSESRTHNKIIIRCEMASRSDNFQMKNTSGGKELFCMTKVEVNIAR